VGARDELDAIGEANGHLRAVRRPGPMALAGALVVVFALQLLAQAFGLRALAEFLRHEQHATANVTFKVE
jgi:hypothetical protein